jgi:hypothetical protein
MALGNVADKLDKEKPAKAKAAAVGVHDPVAFCEEYLDTNEAIKAQTKKLKGMKERLAQLVPQSGSIKKATYPATRDDKPGAYVVQHITSDRRTVNNEALTKLLIDKGAATKDRAFTDALCKTADEAKVAELIKAGKITPAEFLTCLGGTVPSYNTLTFEEIAD